MRLHFSPADPAALLAIAADATASEAFMPDAVPLGCFEGTPKERGDLLAVVVFQNRTTAAAEIHFVGLHPRWCSRKLLTGFYRIAFERMGYEHLRAPIPVGNTAAMVLAIKSGFLPVGRLPSGAAGGGDAILFSMARDDCRWLLPNSGNGSIPADAA